MIFFLFLFKLVSRIRSRSDSVNSMEYDTSAKPRKQAVDTALVSASPRCTAKSSRGWWNCRQSCSKHAVQYCQPAYATLALANTQDQNMILLLCAKGLDCIIGCAWRVRGRITVESFAPKAAAEDLECREVGRFSGGFVLKCPRRRMLEYGLSAKFATSRQSPWCRVRRSWE